MRAKLYSAFFGKNDSGSQSKLNIFHDLSAAPYSLPAESGEETGVTCCGSRPGHSYRYAFELNYYGF